MEQIYAYPLLRLSKDDPPLEQMHKIFIALREFWNTRNAINHDLPWDELDGCRFGLKAIQELLAYPECDRFSKATSVQVDQKMFIALNSKDPSNQMAEFMRWATDAIMRYLTDSSRFGHYTVGSALSKLEKIKQSLLDNTSRVIQSVQLHNSKGHINFRNATMLEILSHFFRVIVRHHKNFSNSRIGVEELLLLAEEVDFVKRHHDNNTTLHAIFAQNEGDRFPLEVGLSNIALAIRNQIEQGGDPMPFEYAIMIVAPIIPRLGHAILGGLPFHRWSQWLQEVGLEQIGERLAADVDRQLLPKRDNATPTPRAPSSVYNTARTHQQSSVASIFPRGVLEALEDASGDERSITSHRTSLFGSREPTPTNALAHPSENLTKRPMKLAPPPTSPDQRKTGQDIGGAQAIDVSAAKKPRILPPSVVPHTHTMSESGWPDGRMEGLAGGLRLPIQRSHAPLDLSASIGTPSVKDNGSEYTNGLAPVVRHGVGRSTIYFGADRNLKWANPEYSMAGSSERAAETIERLKQARPMQKSGKEKSFLSPVGRLGAKVEQELGVGGGSVVDEEEDVDIEGGADKGEGNDGADEDDGNDGADNEDKSEMLEDK